MEEVNASGQTTTKQVIVNQSLKADPKAQESQPIKKKTQKIKKVVKKTNVKNSSKSKAKTTEKSQY